MERIVLIPVKRFDRAKTRLSPRLGSSARRALSEFLLDRTLGVAKRVAGVAQVAVVTADLDAIAVAQRHDATVIEDAEAGLNEAVRRGRDSLLAAHPDLELMVLPTDLPMATADALGRMFARSGDVGIAPDESRSGTNVLLLRGRATAEFQFCFGPESFESHRRQAIERKFSLAVVCDPALAFDVDSVDQYARWEQSADFESGPMAAPADRGL